MTVKASLFNVAILASAFLVISLNVQAKPIGEGPGRSVVVGTLASVDSSGKKFSVQQSGEHLHKLYMNAKSTVYYVGLPARNEQNHGRGLERKRHAERTGSSRQLPSRLLLVSQPCWVKSGSR